MTQPNLVRNELLVRIVELARLRPEWRLGQLVANVAMSAGRLDEGGIWDLEDDEALAAVQELITQARQPQAASA